MGSMKFRQGHSINISRIKDGEEFIEKVREILTAPKPKPHWLVSTFRALTQPFIRVVQNYRRKV